MPESATAPATPLDLLDRLAVGYLTAPLFIFLFGWFEPWAALPLAGLAVHSLRPLVAALPAGGARLPVGTLQFAIAAAIGCAWTVFGGTEHWVFANADWHIRDAVLHDLVLGQWPVSYRALDGQELLLRAPLGFYMPAALIGKAAGLLAAHAAMALWTAAGAILFLLQVLSRVPPRLGPTLTAAAVIVLFSGFDAVGTLLNVPGAAAQWDITRHLEWWAGRYQYSSMTTQLFWVPNHALGGWLLVGLLLRAPPGRAAVDGVLPMAVAATALWSPLTAVGIAPFVLRRLWSVSRRERSFRLADPRVWAPAAAVGVAVSAYLTLDAGDIPKRWIIGGNGTAAAELAMDAARHAEFFLLEAGFIGLAILAIRRSGTVVLALGILALLPLYSFGAWNDFDMRVSIPSLAVLAVGACLALLQPATGAVDGAKKVVLASLLCIGAVTPLQEFARAAVLEPWPINLDSTLIDVTCGREFPHYLARLGNHGLARILRPAHLLGSGREDSALCPQRAKRPRP